MNINRYLRTAQLLTLVIIHTHLYTYIHNFTYTRTHAPSPLPIYMYKHTHPFSRPNIYIRTYPALSSPQLTLHLPLTEHLYVQG